MIGPGSYLPDAEVLVQILIRRIASQPAQGQPQGVLRCADADLAGVVRGVCGRLRPQFDDAGVTLRVRADTPVPVHVDVDRITQVLTNVLGNALLASARGGVVTVTASTDGDRALATVIDTGVGLAPGDRERIFERFYRSPNRQRRSAGSGVGLTIARGLARAHGGDLHADSPGPGRGATFTLRLPGRRETVRDAGDVR